MPTPAISVVVPTYRRAAPLRDCLEALAAQDLGADRFEVVVVDDGSPRPPTAVVERFRERLDVTLLTTPHGGPARARNLGAAHARAPLLAFTDDDCLPDRGWLRVLAEALAAHPGHGIGGCTRNALPDNPYAVMSQFILERAYAYYNPAPERSRFFASNNLALPAPLFQRVGGFDPRFCAAAEDRELCDRWLWHGYRLLFVPRAVVYHAHDLTPRTFWLQHVRYGRGAYRFSRARARRGGAGLRPDPRFQIGAIGVLLATGPPARLPGLFGLFLVSQLANAVGYAWEAHAARRARLTRARGAPASGAG